MKIKRFTLNGKFVDTIGNGKGKGPGEFIQYLDFCFSGDSMHVIDGRKQMLIQFNANNNTYLHSFKMKFRPMRITSVGNKLVVLSLGKRKLFKIFDQNGNKVNQFGKLIEDPLQNSLSLQGNLVSVNSLNEFIFAPRFASYLFYYNLKGDQQKVIQTIDKKSFPTSPHKSSGDVKTISSPRPDLTIESAVKDGNRLYLQYLKRNQEMDTRKAFVDVHNLQTGKYLFSFRLPIASRIMLVTHKRLYLVSYNDAKLLAFKMNSRN